MAQELFTLTLCNSIEDNYRFGFNGQGKVNEIAGVGNHNTAEFWEYDTRLGRRWNLDPVDQVSISNYATFADNPVWKNDALGNTTVVYNLNGQYITTIFDNLSLEIHFIDDNSLGYIIISSSMNSGNVVKFRNSSIAYIGINTIGEMEKLHKDANNYEVPGSFHIGKGKELGFTMNVTKSREIRLNRLPDEYGKASRYEMDDAIKADNWKRSVSKLSEKLELRIGSGHVHYRLLQNRSYDTREELFISLVMPTPPEYNRRERRFNLVDYGPSIGNGSEMLFIITEDGFSIYTSLKNEDRLPGGDAVNKAKELKPKEGRDIYKYENFKK